MTFRDSLKAAVRELAVRTSLAGLRKKGVKEVNVLGLDRVVALIDEAVYRSLKSRLFGVERETVAEATKAEFLRLLRSNEDLQRSRGELQQLKERAEEEVDQLRRDLEGQQKALARKLEQGQMQRRIAHVGEDARIVSLVDELFGELARHDTADLGAVQEKVIELVIDLVSKERKTAAAAESALHDREVDTLQRRIKKLTETLEQNELRLQEVTALKRVDQGISSVYREVQGLSGNENDYARKKELMAEIFKANFKLQKGNATRTEPRRR